MALRPKLPSVRLILATVLLAHSVQAQFTGNNQTNTINGVATIWPDNNGAYVVSQNWAYDALVITNGGSLSNNLTFIGLQPGADSNSVLVTGSGSVWSNATSLYSGIMA